MFVQSLIRTLRIDKVTTEVFQCSTFLRVFLTAFFSSAWDVFSLSP